MSFMLNKNKTDLSATILGLGLLLSTHIVAADHADVDVFGDPDYVVKMDEKWLKQAVKHDKKLEKADLVVSLGQITYPALRQFVQDYAERKGLKIIIQPGSCGVTAKKLSRKMIDVGAYCCPPGKTDRLPGVVFHTLGISPIALITHPENELSGLSLEDARKIFSGDTIRWSEAAIDNKIKLPKKDIQPVVRLHCKKRPGHWRHLLDRDDMFSANIREVGVIPDMVKEVAETKSAIGFETVFMLEVYKSNGEVKILNIDGHHPSDLQQLLFGAYPFYRVFSMTTWDGDERSNQLSRELVESIKKHIEVDGYKYEMISSEKLRLAGWKFKGDELVGEPDGEKVFSENK
jgi:ABC-type phosphate transport system substrate-binding protein